VSASRGLRSRTQYGSAPTCASLLCHERKGQTKPAWRGPQLGLATTSSLEASIAMSARSRVAGSSLGMAHAPRPRLDSASAALQPRSTVRLDPIVFSFRTHPASRVGRGYDVATRPLTRDVEKAGLDLTVGSKASIDEGWCPAGAPPFGNDHLSRQSTSGALCHRAPTSGRKWPNIQVLSIPSTSSGRAGAPGSLVNEHQTARRAFHGFAWSVGRSSWGRLRVPAGRLRRAVDVRVSQDCGVVTQLIVVVASSENSGATPGG
jgi:hypothetical protein